LAAPETSAESIAPGMMSASATSGVLAVVREVLETLRTPTCLDSRTGNAMLVLFTRGVLHLKAMHSAWEVPEYDTLS
jgi:hypothetical protein